LSATKKPEVEFNFRFFAWPMMRMKRMKRMKRQKAGKMPLAPYLPFSSSSSTSRAMLICRASQSEPP
jgi:hypothetical protein